MARVTITFTYANGSPAWKVKPGALHIPHDPKNPVRITWNLSKSSSQGVAFSANGAVVFKDADAWPGSIPTGSGQQYSTIETNANPGPDEISYPYTINVLYGGTVYSHDPDVTNDPPSKPPAKRPESDKQNDR